MPEEDRIAEIRMRFAERGYQLLRPFRLGDAEGSGDSLAWAAPYVRSDTPGGVGSGPTRLHAVEDAWAKLLAEPDPDGPVEAWRKADGLGADSE
jgi:hypothetical protein